MYWMGHLDRMSNSPPRKPLWKYCERQKNSMLPVRGCAVHQQQSRLPATRRVKCRSTLGWAASLASPHGHAWMRLKTWEYFSPLQAAREASMAASALTKTSCSSATSCGMAEAKSHPPPAWVPGMPNICSICSSTSDADRAHKRAVLKLFADAPACWRGFPELRGWAQCSHRVHNRAMRLRQLTSCDLPCPSRRATGPSSSA